MGNLQQALVCFEKRLVGTHEIDDNAHKGSAYGELGCLHSLLGKLQSSETTPLILRIKNSRITYYIVYTVVIIMS